MTDRMMVAMVAFRVTEDVYREISNRKIFGSDFVATLAMDGCCTVIAVSDLKYSNATPPVIAKI